MIKTPGYSIVLCLLAATAALGDIEQLERAVDGEHRTAAWVQRDPYRHPVETLGFFDIEPRHTVVEVWPGGGWYTEILAPYLRDNGKLIAAHYDSGDTQASYRTRSRASFEKKLAAQPAVYDRVEIASLMIDEADKRVAIPAAAPGSVDRVVTFRNAHGWFAGGTIRPVLQHFFDILKPGGKLGVVQHMADEDQDWLSRNIGYVGRDSLIAEATAAGFQLQAEGFFNRNPLDTKRYKGGVWQLPPTLQDMESDAEKAPYLKIGESERMTLLFVKPK